MTRKCHNHRLLTDPLHLKEGTRITDIYNIIKVKQPALFLVKMIAELETNKKTKTRYKTPITNRNNNKQSVQHPHIISEILRYVIINESDLVEQTCYYYFIYCDECKQVQHRALAASESLLDCFVQLKEKNVQISKFV